jgi:hypothetical protein
MTRRLRRPYSQFRRCAEKLFLLPLPRLMNKTTITDHRWFDDLETMEVLRENPCLSDSKTDWSAIEYSLSRWQ